MKIVHVIASLEASVGGPPRVALSMAAAHAAMGHEVSVLAYGNSGRDGTIASMAPFDRTCAGVNVVLMPGPGLLERVYPRNARKELLCAIRLADVLHLHGIWETSLAMAASLAYQRRMRIVITPHGMIADYGMRKRAIKKRIALILYAKRVLGRADVVQALTSNEARQLAKYAPSAKTEIIPNAIDATDFAALPNPSIFRRRVSALKDAPYVIFLARLDFMKGLDRLIAGFALLAQRHSDVQLVIAGPNGDARADAERQVVTLGIFHRVHFVGELSGTDKFSALAGAVCFCQPSRHEGFSISVIEAMACGTPAVVSPDMDIPGLTDNGGGILTAPDPRSIAIALSQFVNDPLKRADASSKARSLVLKCYVWTVVAEQIMCLYRGEQANDR
jgi:glycosyltransferase involved in cell wall biosynthesis